MEHCNTAIWFSIKVDIKPITLAFPKERFHMRPECKNLGQPSAAAAGRKRKKKAGG